MDDDPPRIADDDSAGGGKGHVDPVVSKVAVAVLDPNKVKKFLYKKEPNMAKLKPHSLQLISTTAHLFLQSTVAKVVEQSSSSSFSSSLPADKGASQTATSSGRTRQGNGSSTTTTLISLNPLKQVVALDHSLNFLQESLSNIQESSASPFSPQIVTKDTTITNNNNNKKRTRMVNSDHTWRKAAKTVNATKDPVVSLVSFAAAPTHPTIKDTSNGSDDAILADEEDYD